jgi:hypothetical protein
MELDPRWSRLRFSAPSPSLAGHEAGGNGATTSPDDRLFKQTVGRLHQNEPRMQPFDRYWSASSIGTRNHE